MFLAIQYLGTDRLPALFSMRAWIDAMTARIGILPKNLSDRLLQRLSGLFSNHLPKPMIAYREWYARHLLLKITEGRHRADP
jgi:D-lactate dehydrogenase